MKDDLCAAPGDYQELAKRCVELASECSAPTVAEALRALAVDYLTRAARLRRCGSIESLVVGVAPTTRKPSREPRPVRRPRKRAWRRQGALAASSDVVFLGDGLSWRRPDRIDVRFVPLCGL